MKGMLLAGGALAALAFTGSANAGEWYASVDVGQTVDVEVSGVPFSDGAAYGLDIGYDFGAFRVEGSVNRLSADLDFVVAIEGATTNADLTGYWDIPIGDRATLSLGGGVHYAEVDAETPIFSLEGEGEGFHYGVAGAYALTDSMDFEVEFQRRETDLDMDFVGGLDLEQYVGTVGLRFRL